MDLYTWYGILIPFLGTSLGAGFVFFMRQKMSTKVEHAASGFAGGVMVAASIWSLILPSIDQSSHLGKWSFIPAAVGFWVGILLLMLLDHLIPRLYRSCQTAENAHSKHHKTTMLVLSVTLHNIPEGMAVGVAFAGYLAGDVGISLAGAMALALGIAIQNVPEGAIISMPLKSEGVGKGKSFTYGVLSGVVEPLGALLTIIAANLVVPILPYMLSFAAGAMIYVVVAELIPESTNDGKRSDLCTIFFAIGFSIMMILDVALG